MKILFLTSRFPYPPFRGDKLRVFNFIKGLSEHHDIVLVSYIDPDEQDLVKEMKKYCSRVATTVLKKSGSYSRMLKGAAGKTPFQVLYYQSPEMKQLVEKVIKEEKPDVIHAHLFRMAPYAFPFKDTPKVLDLCDSIALNYSRFLSYRRDIANPAYRVERSRVARYEAEVTAKFDTNVVISSEDEAFLKTNGADGRMAIVANGVDFDYFKSDETVEKKPHRLCFTGTMSYFPNTDGMLFFAREVLPLVKKEVPDVELFIIGNNPTADIKKLADDSAVTVTGFVDDVRPLARSSSVFVCPIRAATGLNNKVLEAMAMGISIVATPGACEGIAVHPEKDILLGSTPQDLADQVVRLLGDEPLRRSLANSALDLVRKDYSWDHNIRKLEAIYNNVREVR